MPRALLSVSDKRGIVELARGLVTLGFEIVSTGGTLNALSRAGVPVTAVSDVTGFPEILEGRVKTLHPAIHSGLLARRDLDEHQQTLAAHGIEPIDLLAVNLYPFVQTVARADVSLGEALENIDIGGPAMVRAAAKNFPSVIVLVDPEQYGPIVDQIAQWGVDGITPEQRQALAATAFAHVASYDAVVAAYLESNSFPERVSVAGAKLADLPYGENPHQRAALYERLAPGGRAGVATWSLRAGPALSFNNYVDANAAMNAATGFDGPACAIVKHANPCGIAAAPDLRTAYEGALASDPVSAFGGVVAFNQPLDAEAAATVAGHHFDIVIAPEFAEDAFERLRRKKNLRLVAAGSVRRNELQLRTLNGAFLLQEPDTGRQDLSEWRVVTRRRPTDEERAALTFVWQAVRYVGSNAIVLGRGTTTVGIGGGQPNRVDAVRIAVQRAGERAQGSVLASDAFFPFADNIEVAAGAGVTAIIAPGGSRRDEEVVAAADSAGMAMIFTGMRHFRH